MRMKLQYELQNCTLDLDYRRMFLSFIKKSLEESDNKFYQEMYVSSLKTKRFTFSVQLYRAKYMENSVLLEEPKFDVLLSTADYGIFLRFYNAFLRQKNISFPVKHENVMKLSKIFLENEITITLEEMLISLASPLVVREHIRETNKDNYYIHSDEKFLSCLKAIIKNDLEGHELLTETMVDELEVESVACKFVLVKAFGSRIPASLGKFRLKGDKRLLKYLYDCGMGSRRGEGFGMFSLM
ncbi:CRISPR associated protein Cas6 [Pelotomaculum schinkii]|uniref:CRISPR associated protein Cas6 n=1 Tax=Pelotomaculum schinkii TaxID=78350 RepID=A0A4Y7RAZ4_9FIRM|nr:CRISPR-associated endoribonuclease Cas6 [Pelotomaculum schinkii]TEB05982.1 CRISPR associated protein Cas6 [Pelotomaculum schinkii]